MRSNLFRPAALLAGILFVGAALAPTSGAAARSASMMTVTSSSWADFAGTAWSGYEDVLVMGRVHLVTQVTAPEGPPVRIDVHANLAQGVGIGLTTGMVYRLTGAATMDPYLAPDGPPNLPPFTLGFRMLPDGPPTSPPDPIRLRFNLSFDAEGNLVETIVNVHVP